ncbi:hypothetical protein [Methyloversatilis thermotolerans]|uniref:hypothetical protein n=1 Tax=Methyloversatilis thermotolerans TaxID=1346290 RepID=UPI00036A6E73|nr:hypothetical protein [Methyloversatilis thermotolerans]
MNRTLVAALAFGALMSGAPAQAAVQNWTFSGSFDSGVYAGASYSGSVSFDDAGVLGAGQEWIALDGFSISLLGHSFSLADALGLAEAAFFDGSFVGVSYSVNDAAEPLFSMIAGYAAIEDAFIAYDSANGFSGAGSLLFAPVPEADGWMMMLAGLCGMGVIARRRITR